MGDEQALRLPGVDSGRNAKVHHRANLSRDGGGHARDRRRVDGEDVRHRARPQEVGDLAPAHDIHTLEDAGIGAKARQRVCRAVPTGARVQTVDGRLAIGVAEGREDMDQRSQSIGGRPAERAGVDGRLQRADGDQHAAGAAQARRHGGDAELDVARVGHDDHLGGEESRVTAHEGLETAR